MRTQKMHIYQYSRKTGKRHPSIWREISSLSEMEERKFRNRGVVPRLYKMSQDSQVNTMSDLTYLKP